MLYGLNGSKFGARHMTNNLQVAIHFNNLCVYIFS